jgi:hypothetical protein
MERIHGFSIKQYGIYRFNYTLFIFESSKGVQLSPRNMADMFVKGDIVLTHVYSDTRYLWLSTILNSNRFKYSMFLIQEMIILNAPHFSSLSILTAK